LTITDDNEPNASYTVEVFSDQIGGSEVASIVRTQSVTGNGMHSITGVSYQGWMTVLQRGWGVEVSQLFDSEAEAEQKAAELRAAEGTVSEGTGGTTRLSGRMRL
jgi:hypothetical protein